MICCEIGNCIFSVLQIFVGNSDHDTVVRHVLKEPFITKQLTIRPVTWKENVGLRMELYGCTLGRAIIAFFFLIGGSFRKVSFAQCLVFSCDKHKSFTASR